MVPADPSSALGLIQSSAVRPIAVSSAARVAALPDVPTVAESGFEGYDLVAWVGAFVPARTPPSVITKLNQELVAAILKSEAHSYFRRIGGEAYPSTPLELVQFVTSETAKWARIVQAARIEKE